MFRGYQKHDGPRCSSEIKIDLHGAEAVVTYTQDLECEHYCPVRDSAARRIRKAIWKMETEEKLRKFTPEKIETLWYMAVWRDRYNVEDSGPEDDVAEEADDDDEDESEDENDGCALM